MVSKSRRNPGLCRIRSEADSKPFEADIDDQKSNFSGDGHIAHSSLKLLESASVEDAGLASFQTNIVDKLSVTNPRKIATAIRRELGELPTTSKSRDVEGTFMEIILVQSALSASCSVPRCHRLEIIIEAVVRSSNFEESLNFFIKRIAEEAYNADQSLKVISTDLKASAGGQGMNIIPIKSMKSKRQQVLSILKAAVVDDGEIYLEFFFESSKLLAPLLVGQCEENTIGFVFVTRKYRFSHVDTAKDVKRCFAKNPFESLSMGIFLDAGNLSLYKDLYIGHASRMGAAAQASAAAAAASHAASQTFLWGKSNPDPAPLKDILLEGLLEQCCELINDKLKAGFLLDATETMMVLANVLNAGKRPKLSATEPRRLQLQLRSVMTSPAGHIRSVRDAVTALHGACMTIAQAIQQSTALAAHIDEEVVVTSEARKEIEILQAHYEAVPAALQELKLLLLELIRTSQVSEFSSIYSGLQHQLWALFHPVRKTDPIVDPDPHKISKKGLQGVPPILQWTARILQRINAHLLMVETSIAMHIIRSILISDIRATAASNLVAAQRDRKSMSVPPKTLTELLGYVDCKARGESTWAPFWHRHPQLSMTLHEAALPRAVIPSVVAETELAMSVTGGRGPAKAGDNMGLALSAAYARVSATKNAFSASFDDELLKGHCCDVFAALGYNSWARFGAVDLKAAVLEEVQRYELPKFMNAEAAQLRYLQETQVAAALHECLFEVAVRPTSVSPFKVICSRVCKYASRVELMDGVSDDAVKQHVFGPVRRSKLEAIPIIAASVALGGDVREASMIDGGVGVRGVSGSAGSAGGDGRSVRSRGGVEDAGRSLGSSWGTVPYKCRLSSQLLRGRAGLFGHDRLLCCLGGIEEVYKRAWMVPPFCGSPPQYPPGMRAQLHCGISAETAVAWGKPDLHALRQRATGGGGGDGGSGGSGGDSTPKVEPDNGLLDQFDGVELEVVIKMHYDHPSFRATVPTEFAKLVVDCCKHMATQSSLWYVQGLTPGNDLSEGPNRLFWDGQDIAVAAADETAKAVLLSAMGRRGSAVVDAAFYCPEQAAWPDLEQLLAIISNSTTQQQQQQQQSRSPSRVEATTAQADLFDDPSQGQQGFNGERDPTADDFSRIYASGLASIRIQKFLRSSRAVQYLVPCRLRFSLLAVMPQQQLTGANRFKKAAHGTGRISSGLFAPGSRGSDGEAGGWARGGEGGGGGGIQTRGSGGNVLGSRGGTRVGTGESGGAESGGAFGALDALPRLCAATVWLSPEAAREVWGTSEAAAVPKSAAQAATVAEVDAARRFKVLATLIGRNSFVEAFEQMYVVSALVEALEALPDCARALSNKSLPRRLANAVRATALVRAILQRDGALIVDVAALAFTIQRQVCLALRLAITSPQSVHFRGGCYLLLKKVEALEMELNLEPISLMAVITGLPTSLDSSAAGNVDPELKFRTALGFPARVQAACGLLLELEDLSSVLLQALGRDVLEALPALEAFSKARSLDQLRMAPVDAMHFALGDEIPANVAREKPRVKRMWLRVCREWASRRVGVSLEDFLSGRPRRTADPVEATPSEQGRESGSGLRAAIFGILASNRHGSAAEALSQSLVVESPASASLPHESTDAGKGIEITRTSNDETIKEKFKAEKSTAKTQENASQASTTKVNAMGSLKAVSKIGKPDAKTSDMDGSVRPLKGRLWPIEELDSDIADTQDEPALKDVVPAFTRNEKSFTGAAATQHDRFDSLGVTAVAAGHFKSGLNRASMRAGAAAAVEEPYLEADLKDSSGFAALSPTSKQHGAFQTSKMYSGDEMDDFVFGDIAAENHSSAYGYSPSQDRDLDHSDLSYNGKVQTFSSSGFKLTGQAVQEASRSGSMLNLLRAFSDPNNTAAAAAAAYRPQHQQTAVAAAAALHVGGVQSLPLSASLSNTRSASAAGSPSPQLESGGMLESLRMRIQFLQEEAQRKTAVAMDNDDDLRWGIGPEGRDDDGGGAGGGGSGGDPEWKQRLRQRGAIRLSEVEAVEISGAYSNFGAVPGGGLGSTTGAVPAVPGVAGATTGPVLRAWPVNPISTGAPKSQSSAEANPDSSDAIKVASLPARLQEGAGGSAAERGAAVRAVGEVGGTTPAATPAAASNILAGSESSAVESKGAMTAGAGASIGAYNIPASGAEAAPAQASLAGTGAVGAVTAVSSGVTGTTLAAEGGPPAGPPAEAAGGAGAVERAPIDSGQTPARQGVQSEATPSNGAVKVTAGKTAATVAPVVTSAAGVTEATGGTVAASAAGGTAAIGGTGGTVAASAAGGTAGAPSTASASSKSSSIFSAAATALFGRKSTKANKESEKSTNAAGIYSNIPAAEKESSKTVPEKEGSKTVLAASVAVAPPAELSSSTSRKGV